MSTAPSAKPLFQYIPGIGKIPVVQCAPCPTGPTGFTGSTGMTGPVGPGGALTSSCGFAYSTTDQTLTQNVAARVIHDTLGFNYDDITITTGAAEGTFTVASTGVYKIIPSLQLLGQNQGILHIWLKKSTNGGVTYTNIPDTGTATHYKTNDEIVITCEYLVQLNAGDKLQVWAHADTAATIINYIAGGGAPPNDYPACPGVITNIYRIR